MIFFSTHIYIHINATLITAAHHSACSRKFMQITPSWWKCKLHMWPCSFPILHTPDFCDLQDPSFCFILLAYYTSTRQHMPFKPYFILDMYLFINFILESFKQVGSWVLMWGREESNFISWLLPWSRLLSTNFCRPQLMCVYLIHLQSCSTNNIMTGCLVRSLWIAFTYVLVTKICKISLSKCNVLLTCMQHRSLHFCFLLLCFLTRLLKFTFALFCKEATEMLMLFMVSFHTKTSPSMFFCLYFF